MRPSAPFDPGWLDLREPADARARSVELAEQVARLPHRTVHDLGCGTGSMGRWLAPRLSGPQHWVLHDHDAELLAVATARSVGTALDAAEVTMETRRGDLSGLDVRDLAGACLITASAVLDVITQEELRRLAALCVAARCPALLTLTVVGEVELTPGDPLDAEVMAAFNDHQRRSVDGRRLLGPDAAAVATRAFGQLGARVDVRPSPWRLGPESGPLMTQWLSGWVGAAAEQRPDRRLADYLHRRLDAARAGSLHVVVRHVDLLARLE